MNATHAGLAQTLLDNGVAMRESDVIRDMRSWKVQDITTSHSAWLARHLVQLAANEVSPLMEVDDTARKALREPASLGRAAFARDSATSHDDDDVLAGIKTQLSEVLRAVKRAHRARLAGKQKDHLEPTDISALEAALRVFKASLDNPPERSRKRQRALP